jgi:DNA-binding NarL/FixJ family response regulator
MGLRVVIADDHALLREGVSSLLAAVPDVEVVGVAGDLDELLAVVDATAPDAVVTDIRMPPTHTTEGIEAAEAIRKRDPRIGVVVLSMYAEAEYVRSLVGDGAAGRAYLLKSRVRDAAELVRAIRAVAAGDSVLDPKVVEALLTTKTADPSGSLIHLSERERAVLAEMAGGRSNVAIAKHLYMSIKTVEKHVGAIFTKLGLAEEASVNRRVVAVAQWLQASR